MSKEIQSIIIGEIERETDLYKKMELITIALGAQIEQNQKLESILERQTKTLDEAANFSEKVLAFMKITTEKIQEIHKYVTPFKAAPAGTSQSDEIIILKKNISLLQENLSEVYELIINMK